MTVADFLDFMPVTVSHAALASRDGYGKPTFGTATSYSARVLNRHVLVKDRQGREVIARTVVWLAGTPTIDPEDRVTLADGTTPPILAVEKYPDEAGAHHVKLFLG
jgi:hypothetical protein